VNSKIIAALEKSKGKIICTLTQSKEKYLSAGSACFERGFKNVEQINTNTKSTSPSAESMQKCNTLVKPKIKVSIFYNLSLGPIKNKNKNSNISPTFVPVTPKRYLCEFGCVLQ
jgi:hypothetical protein